MPFGSHSHKGKTLDVIALTDAGLRWLDWLRGQRDADYTAHKPVTVSADWRELQGHLIAYLDDPVVARDLRELGG